MFIEGREYVYDEARSGRPSLVNADLVCKVNDRVRDGRRYFHLFLHLNQFLGGKRFYDDDDLKDAVQNWLTSQAAAFYEEGIQKLVPRYDKCHNNGGEYVE